VSKSKNKTSEAVILLHGLGRTKYSFLKLAFALKADYQVVNLGYPSRRYSIETLAELAITPALERCQEAARVHFVTHSMGGILVRQYLTNHAIKQLGNTVMLGPPNKGSKLVDFFLNQAVLAPVFKRINGPAGCQLGTDHTAVPTTLGEACFNLGVIAGNVNRNPIFNTIMGDDHDGKVSVDSSKLTGMNDHIVMPVDHTFMMQNTQVIAQIKHFLREGEFRRGIV